MLRLQCRPSVFGAGGLVSVAMMSRQRSTHSLQIQTPDPATILATLSAVLPQNEHLGGAPHLWSLAIASFVTGPTQRRLRERTRAVTVSVRRWVNALALNSSG